MAPEPGGPRQRGRAGRVFLSAGINFSMPVHLLELIVSEGAHFLLKSPETILVTASHNKAIV